MNFVKRISALLAAIMAFSFIGMSINTETVQAASTISCPMGDVVNYYGHVSYSAVKVGKAKYIDFKVPNTTNATISDCTYYDRIAYLYGSTILPFTSFDNLSYTSADAEDKYIRLGSYYIKPEFYDNSGYLIPGIYEITVNDVSFMVEITGNESDGEYRNVNTGTLNISVDGASQSYTQNVPYGSISMIKTGNTYKIGANLQNAGYSESVYNMYVWEINYWELGQNINIGSPQIFSYVTGVRNWSFNQSLLPDQYQNANGYIKPGYYQFVIKDYSPRGEVIASQWLYITGVASDGHPTTTPTPRPSTTTTTPTPYVNRANAKWYYTDNGIIPATQMAYYTDSDHINLFLSEIGNVEPSQYGNITWSCTYNGSEIASGIGRDGNVYLSRASVTPVNGNFPEGRYYITFYYNGKQIFSDYCDVLAYTVTATPTPYVNRDNAKWYYTDDGIIPATQMAYYTNSDHINLFLSEIENIVPSQYGDITWRCTYNGTDIATGTGRDGNVYLSSTSVTPVNGNFPAGRYYIIFTYNGTQLFRDYCDVINTANVTPSATPYVNRADAKWYYTDSGIVPATEQVYYTNSDHINLFLSEVENMVPSQYGDITWRCTYNGTDIATGTGRDGNVYLSRASVTPVNGNFPEGRYYIIFTYNGTQLFRDYCNVIYSTPTPTDTVTPTPTATAAPSPYVDRSDALWYYTDNGTVDSSNWAYYTNKDRINLYLFSVNNLTASQYRNITWTCTYDNSVIASGTGKDANIGINDTTNITPINGCYPAGRYTIIFTYNGRQLFSDFCDVIYNTPTPTATNTPRPTNTNTPTSTPTVTPIVARHIWTGVYNNSTTADYDALYLNTKKLDLEVILSGSGINVNNVTWTCERVGFSGNMATGSGLHAIVNSSNATAGSLINSGFFRVGHYTITFYNNGVAFYSSTAFVGTEPTPTLTPRATNTPTATPTVFVPTNTPTPTPTLAPGVISAVWYDIDGNVVPNRTYTEPTFIELDAMFSNVSSVTYACFYNNSIIAEGASNVAAINIARTNIAGNGKFPVGDYTIVYYGPDGNVIFEDTCTVIARPTDTPTNTPTVTPTTSPNPVTPTPEALRCFVTRCYTECLGRDYDVAGHDYWEHCLSGAFNGCDVAKEFFFSDEFVNARHSNEEFVRRLYRTFMDRDPEPEGFQFWMNCLNNGSSRLDIFYGFINSPEWRDICAVYGSCINSSIRSGGYVMPQGVSISASNQTIAFVARLYSEGLGRDPEGPGLEMWSEALDQGTATGRQVAREFFLGAEFTNLNVSNTEFLIRAYRIFMDRPIDIDNDPGFLHWLNQLNSGAISRADIIDTFAASDEFAVVCRNAGFNA